MLPFFKKSKLEINFEIWWRPTISRRAILPKYFENIFKTNDSVGVTRQQTWLRNEEIAEYFGENLDILTDLNMDFQ